MSVSAPEPEPEAVAESASTQAAPTVVVPVPSPAGPPPPSWAASQVTNYVPPLIPPEVWTPELAAKVVENWRNNDDKNHAAATDYRSKEFKKALMGYGFVAAVAAVGIVFIATGLPGGQEMVVGAVAFAAGFLAGDGNAKSQR